MSRSELVEDILIDCNDDWLMEANVISLVKADTELEDPAAIRREVIAVVADVVSRGWAELGDTPKGMGFRPWTLPLDEAVDRLNRRWDGSSEAYPFGGEVFWLRSTPEGDAEAAKILDRWNNGDVP